MKGPKLMVTKKNTKDTNLPGKQSEDHNLCIS